MTDKQTECTSAPGTKNCKRTVDTDEPASEGWALVHEVWWCDNCMERYGFIPDKNQVAPK